MFNNFTTKASFLGLVGMGFFLTPASANTDPYNPVGELTVSPTTVHAGVHTNLDWNIRFPIQVTDIVDIQNDDSITTKKETRVQFRVVGASWSSATTFYTVQGYARLGEASYWSQIFYGKEYNINPFHYVIDQIVPPGTNIDVAARGHQGGHSWSDWQWTLEETPNVVALINGDEAPHLSAAYSIQNDVESYLTQYIGEDGNITLGPRDVIYLFDFNSPTSSGFDLQDFVCVITFTEIITEVQG